ncbi:MAG: DUF349 domain-containing protein [Porphyromonadaceae bacterium]|nr:DUF349 domain-containing protein [Porphyromonadaceae bacterium]
METQHTTLSPEVQIDLQSPSTEQVQATQAEATPQEQGANSLKTLIDRIATLISVEEVSKEVLEEVSKLRSVARRRLQEINSSRTVTPEEVEVAAIQEARLGDLNRTIREHERKVLEQRTALFAANKDRGAQILSDLAALLDAGEDFGKVYAEFHRLKDEWQACRPLDPQDEAALRKTFAELRDKFYELKAINEELREYDYRKNLEAKRALLDELKALSEQTDVLALYQSALPLISKWHELGPVAKDIRAEVHGEFKALTTQIYKLHQGYHDERKAREQANLEAKTRLCEAVEAIIAEQPEGYAAWQVTSERLKALQEEWRKIGYATKKENDRIYQRFRQSYDTFYAKWKSFTSEMHHQRKSHNQRKEQLIEEVKRIAEGNDWEAGTQRIKEIQQEWKGLNIPSVRANHKLWVELRKHIDAFFERKAAEQKAQGTSYEQNLERKRAILDQLANLKEVTDLSELRKHLDSLGGLWKEIGHVPGKYKDEINGKYKAYMDEYYNRLRQGREQRRLEGYSSKIEQVARQEGGVQQELRKLQYALERAKSELQTYENNLGFLNVDNKGGAGLLKMVERKREQLAGEVALMEEKLALLRSKL